MHFENPQAFESRVMRAVTGGVVGGIAHTFLASFATVHGLPLSLTPFPATDGGQMLSFAGASLAGATIAAWPGSFPRRWLGVLFSVGTLFFASLLEVHPAWRVAFAAAALGAFWTWAQVQDKGNAWKRQLAGGWIRPAAGSVAAALAIAAGARVAVLLGQAADAWMMPGVLIAALGGSVVGLFFGLSTGTVHLVPALDPVETSLEGVLPRLTGELAEAARRALERYRQCARILAQLPAEPTREALAQTLSKTATEVATLAGEWASLEALIAEVRTETLEGQIASLRQRAATVSDPLARRQLEHAAAALQESRDRAGLLVEQRERVHAKLHASVALLECARLALLGTQGGETQLRATELASVSERLQALVAAQGEDARWVDALATGAELSVVEARQRV